MCCVVVFLFEMLVCWLFAHALELWQRWSAIDIEELRYDSVVAVNPGVYEARVSGYDRGRQPGQLLHNICYIFFVNNLVNFIRLFLFDDTDSDTYTHVHLHMHMLVYIRKSIHMFDFCKKYTMLYTI